MRQLFLPACLCLMTWSGTVVSEPGLSLDQFTDSRAAGKKHAMQMAALDVGSAPAATPSAPPAVAELRPGLDADLAIEAPVPSGKVVNNGEPAGIPLPPVYKPVVPRSLEEVCETLASAAQNNNLPVPFFIRLLFQESRFKPDAVSSAGAQGIAQFMPTTAADMGVDNPFDPLQAIPASAQLLRNLLQQFGNLGLAAAAYNAGPKRIQDWLEKKGVLPQETQGYVKTITGQEAAAWSEASSRHPEQKLPRRAPCQEAAGLYAWNGPGAIPVPAPSPLHKTAEKAVVKVAAAKSATFKVADATPAVSNQSAARHSAKTASLEKAPVQKGSTQTISASGTGKTKSGHTRQASSERPKAENAKAEKAKAAPAKKTAVNNDAPAPHPTAAHAHKFERVAQR